MQDCKDRSGLQFVKIDFVTDGQEIKWNCTVLAVMLSLQFIFL